MAENSLEVVTIRECIAHLPHGPLDGLVHFMQEAYRCLEPGGSLTIRAPMASHKIALMDPRNCRFFNETSFTMFAKPAAEEDWRWDRYGTDFGVRFNVIHMAAADDVLNVSLEKIGD